MENNIGGRRGIKGLARIAGWLSAVCFALGAISALTGEYLIVSGNDYWQASLYLVLFGIFANTAKE